MLSTLSNDCDCTDQCLYPNLCTHWRERCITSCVWHWILIYPQVGQVFPQIKSFACTASSGGKSRKLIMMSIRYMVAASRENEFQPEKQLRLWKVEKKRRKITKWADRTNHKKKLLKKWSVSYTSTANISTAKKWKTTKDRRNYILEIT